MNLVADLLYPVSTRGCGRHDRALTLAPRSGRAGRPSRAFWRAVPARPRGLAGLGILRRCSSLVALFAPLLADADGLSVTKATGPQLAAPVRGLPAGHRRRRAARC